MGRHISVFAILVSATGALGASSPDPMTCPWFEGERSPGALFTSDVPLGTITIDAFLSGEFHGQVVDVRPENVRSRTPLPGVLALDLVQLRSLAEQGDGELVIVGAGYDDHRLSARLAGWGRTTDRIRPIEGGAASWVLAMADDFDGGQIRAALAVPPMEAVAAAKGAEWQVVGIGISTEVLAQLSRTKTVRELSFKDSVDLDTVVSGIDLDRAVLLVCSDGRQSATVAEAMSHRLGRPVFYAKGGTAALMSYWGQYASINHQPRTRRNYCQ
jgi:rhodanese-related sulfurtransferase